MRKPKTPQKELTNEISGRDLFQTPNYGTDLLIPFIPEYIKMIWECACGEGKIANVLLSCGYSVTRTDLQFGTNFLTQETKIRYDAIVTNPPFSLKRRFYERCRQLGTPFALLIPADYSAWVIKAIDDGAEKIIPTRRIDYITPDTINRIHQGEIWKHVKSCYPKYKTLAQFKEEKEITWEGILEKYEDYCWYECVDEVPRTLLREYSTSQFHSMWLTWDFHLGKTETFVELTNDMKLNI